ncbi:MAG: exodeoxyribonuclease VII large subunit, partial [Epulopiscium sp.]|nr:exodeoxyribonuclease VII large subunit [Candidatus Epulonipiscium sp.]
MNNQRIFTVSEINRYIKNLFEEDLLLSGLWIQGEISNFKPHRSGHIYFTLKDEQGSIACVMFRSYAQNLAFIPEDGMSVIVKGYVSLYEKSGQYQLYVQTIEPAGKGALQLAYEQLKSKLHEKGFFDQERKKRIPFFPRTVGIVTSDTGAAIRDIIQIAKRRNPSVSLVIYPVLVQGKEAAASIAHGIEQFNRWNKAEVLIVGRGGGSLEDLWAFNEEVVAQAIFDS